MGSSRLGRYHQRAARYESRANNYRRQAELLLERDNDTDCAGALLYEAAKQCVNAVANLLGDNPGTTGGKVSALRRIAAGQADDQALLRTWQSADKLHVHADRDNLDDAEFSAHWVQTQVFIDTMLTIYQRNA